MVNPVFAFIGSWGLALLLYGLRFTTNIVDVSWSGVAMILMNMISVCLFYLIFNFYFQKNKLDFVSCDFMLKSFVRWVFYIWFGGTLFEIGYCKGVPLYWRLIGDDKLYIDFGIHSLHGVLNACFLQIATIYSYIFFKYHQRKALVYIMLLSLWPLMILGRGIFLLEILQIFCVYMLINKLKVKNFFYIATVTIFVLLMFGIVGDFRHVANPFKSLVKNDASFLLSLPSGVLWFYMYVTAGLSNLFYNIDSINVDYSFHYSFMNMIPSAISRYLGIDSRHDLFVFVDHNLNTSTGYAGFVSDFGPVGGFLMVAFIQLCCCLVFRVCQQRKPWGIFAYAVLFPVLVFSVFYDMFFLLPTLFQLVICFIFYLRSSFVIKRENINGNKYSHIVYDVKSS